MRWQDLDASWWTIPAEFAKNRLAHRVPLARSPHSLCEGRTTWAPRRGPAERAVGADASDGAMQVNTVLAGRRGADNPS
jgi:hypothetical protein